jgi:hypothetical protein
LYSYEVLVPLTADDELIEPLVPVEDDCDELEELVPMLFLLIDSKSYCYNRD